MDKAHSSRHAHNFKDLTGQTFDWLTVLRLSHVKKGYGAFWICKCQCGNEHVVIGKALRRGHTKTCGCRPSALRHGHARKGPRTREYNCWLAIKDRCYNPNNAEYNRYGGRGIVVCEQWKKSFTTFLADMGPKPSGRYEIDRMNLDGHYEPTNCRWTTRHWQARNRSDNRFFTFHGETLCIQDWAIRLGMSFTSMEKRFRRWSIKEALTTPAHTKTRTRRNIQ